MPSACPGCGFPLDPGAGQCPHCKALATDAPVPRSVPVEESPRRAAPVFDRVTTGAMPRVTDTSAVALRERVGAFTIDLAIALGIAAVYVVAGALAYGVADLRAAGGGSVTDGAIRLAAEAPGLATAIVLLLLAVTSGYFIWFQGAESRTLGMAVFGLRVVRVDGRPLGIAGALSRWGAFLLAVAVFGLGVIWTAFSEVQRGLHDHLSGTTVVRA